MGRIQAHLLCLTALEHLIDVGEMMKRVRCHGSNTRKPGSIYCPNKDQAR